jgi:hypothetical protein
VFIRPLCVSLVPHAWGLLKLRRPILNGSYRPIYRHLQLYSVARNSIRLIFRDMLGGGIWETLAVLGLPRRLSNRAR